MRARRILAVSLVLALPGLTGCSRFQASRKLDMSPFAENTNTMVGEIQRVNRPPSWTYLKPYRERPTVLAAREAAAPVRRLLANVALYSSQIVALDESRMAESKKAQALAGYLDEVARPGVVAGQTLDIGITPAGLDTVLDQIRKSETFIAALKAAQPLVHATTIYGGKLLDQLDQAVGAAANDVDAELETRFRPLRRNLNDMQDIHTRVVGNYAKLYQARFGDESALDELLKSDPGVAAMIPKGKKPGAREFDAVELKLTTELDRVDTVRRQLLPEFELYRAHQAELEALRTQTQETIRLARTTFSLWSRSHRNLAAGIAVPPAIDVAGMFRSTAQSAAGKLPGF